MQIDASCTAPIRAPRHHCRHLFRAISNEHFRITGPRNRCTAVARMTSARHDRGVTTKQSLGRPQGTTPPVSDRDSPRRWPIASVTCRQTVSNSGRLIQRNQRIKVLASILSNQPDSGTRKGGPNTCPDRHQFDRTCDARPNSFATSVDVIGAANGWRVTPVGRSHQSVFVPCKTDSDGRADENAGPVV
jgi:hypothetical protein